MLEGVWFLIIKAQLVLQKTVSRDIADANPADVSHKWSASMGSVLVILTLMHCPLEAAQIVQPVAPVMSSSLRPATLSPIAVPVRAVSSGSSQKSAVLALLDGAILEGRLVDARALITPLWPDATDDIRLRGAEILLASSDFERAATLFSSLLQSSQSAPAYQGLGIAQLKQGRVEDAKKALDVAVKLDPLLSRAWNALGVLADNDRNWDLASAAYQKATTAVPDNPVYVSNWGWSYLLRGDFVAAEQLLARAVALSPKFAAARTNLAIARAMQGRYADAFLHSDKISLSEDLNSVGFSAMARSDFAVAEAYFQRALALSPQFHAAARANLDYMSALKANVPTKR